MGLEEREGVCVVSIPSENLDHMVVIGRILVFAHLGSHRPWKRASRLTKESARNSRHFVIYQRIAL